jgi:hypothetical protein
MPCVRLYLMTLNLWDSLHVTAMVRFTPAARPFSLANLARMMATRPERLASINVDTERKQVRAERDP